MTDKEKSPRGACREYELLMMRLLDGEISESDRARLESHLKSCADCARAMKEYGEIVSTTANVRMKEPPREEWELYWASVSNRIERTAAWSVISLGLAIVAAFLVVWFVGFISSSPLPLLAKCGIFILAAGAAWLFLSVFREKWTLRKKDKYTGVIR